MSKERARQGTGEQSDPPPRVGDDVRRRLAHDARASLSTIVGWTEIVRQSGADPVLRARAVETVLRHVEQVSRRVDEMVELWRLESGDLVLSMAPVPIAAVLKTVLTRVRAASAPDASWRLEVDDDPRFALADRTYLERALAAVLEYAARHAVTGQQTVVSLGGTDQTIVVTVSNEESAPTRESGEALTPAVPRTVDGPLLVAREWLEVQRGRLEMTDGEPPALVVTMPAFSRDLARAETTRLSHVRQLDGVRVLVVDDDPDARDAVAGILRYHGASVTTAASASDALARLGEQPLDVMLADIAMPGRDGYDLMREVRHGKGASAQIGAAAVTAFSAKEDRQRALEAGFQAHIAKPVQADRLLATVLSLAGRPSI